MWKTVKLGDVSEVKAGNSAPQDDALFENGLYPFVRTSDVGAIKVGRLNSARDNLNDNGIKKLKLFKKGTVLFPKSGASTFLNHRVILSMDAYVSSHLATIKADNEYLLDEYVWYYLQTIDAAQLVADSAYPSLQAKTIKEIAIPLPPLLEQQRIVAKLDAAFGEIDETIAGCEAQLSKMKNLNQKIFDNEFNAENSRVEFENIVTEKGTGLERRANLQGANRAFSYLKMNNISSENRLSLDKHTAVDASAEEVEKYTLNEGDFLFNTRNSVELVGKTAVVSGISGWLFNNNILRVKFVKGVSADYINYFFCSSDGKQQLSLRKTGTTNVAAVYYKDLKTIRIPVSTENEQDRIVSKLKAIEKQSSFYKSALKNKISTLRSLKSAILTQELQSEAA